VIALGLAARFTTITVNETGAFPDYYDGVEPVLAIASAAITILTLPTLLVVDFLRTGAFTSMVVVELASLCSCPLGPMAWNCHRSHSEQLILYNHGLPL